MRPLTSRAGAAVLLFHALAFAASPAVANVPQTLTQQGKLFSAGSPLTGTMSITFHAERAVRRDRALERDANAGA